MKQACPDRRLGHPGDLARARRAHLLDLAKDERLALRDRQAIERGFQAQPELAAIGVRFRVGAGQPVLPRQPLQRPAPPERGAPVVPRALHRDREDERLDVDVTAETARGADQRREHVLDDVLGAGRIRQEPARQHAHAPVPPIERFRERLDASGLQSIDDGSVARSVRTLRRDSDERWAARAGVHGSRSLTPILELRNHPLMASTWTPNCVTRSNPWLRWMPAVACPRAYSPGSGSCETVVSEEVPAALVELSVTTVLTIICSRASRPRPRFPSRNHRRHCQPEPTKASPPM